jgi:hypothetical protein
MVVNKGSYEVLCIATAALIYSGRFALIYYRSRLQLTISLVSLSRVAGSEDVPIAAELFR